MLFPLIQKLRELSVAAALSPDTHLEASLAVGVLPGGELQMDARSIESGTDFSVFAEALRLFVEDPGRYFSPWALVPRVVRLYVYLAPMIGNRDIQVLERIVAPLSEQRYLEMSRDRLTLFGRPEAAETFCVFESIDLSGNFLVSLTGGRLLRGMARRHVALMSVDTEGTSMSRAVSQHILAATLDNQTTANRVHERLDRERDARRAQLAMVDQLGLLCASDTLSDFLPGIMEI